MEEDSAGDGLAGLRWRGEQDLTPHSSILIRVLHPDLRQPAAHRARRLVGCQDALAGRNNGLKSKE